ASPGSAATRAVASCRASTISFPSFSRVSNRRLFFRPAWAAPSTLPSPRCSRSILDSSNPSRVAATRSSRSRALPPSGASVTSRHRPGLAPRPTRPRSWWSWDTPNLSASMITIAVAFGTSTPTSTTVVATRTSTEPSANSRITASFSSAAIRPCMMRSRRPASGPLLSSAAVSSTACGGRAADAGAHNVRLAAALLDLFPEPRPGTGQVVRLFRGRHHMRLDRDAAGRQLGEGEDVEVAEDRHGHGARDRGRGHHEQVGAAVPGLTAQRVALLHAEAVLLVHHDQAKVEELDSLVVFRPVIKQRMGADHDPGVPESHIAESLLADPRALRTGDQGHPGRLLRAAELPGMGERAEQFDDGPVMLLREDFRRREQRGLPAVVNNLEHRPDRDDRLARAD